MLIRIVFWYPSKKEKEIPTMLDDSTGLEAVVNCLTDKGLNVLIPSNYKEIETIYVDEKRFGQR